MKRVIVMFIVAGGGGLFFGALCVVLCVVSFMEQYMSLMTWSETMYSRGISQWPVSRVKAVVMILAALIAGLIASLMKYALWFTGALIAWCLVSALL